MVSLLNCSRWRPYPAELAVPADHGKSALNQGFSNTLSYAVCADPYLRAIRAGPIPATPSEYVGLYVNIPSTLFEGGERIVKFTGRAVDKSGKPVGHPPLHVHHLHVRRRTYHAFQTHGDYGNDPSYGLGGPSSAEGYTRTLPNGYCFTQNSHPKLPNSVFRSIEAEFSATAPRAQACASRCSMKFPQAG